MKDYESVIVVVVVGYHAYDFCPAHWIHVAGIDRWVEFSHIDFCLNELEFGHGRNEVIEIKRFQYTCHRVLSHTDGTTGIDDENLWFCHFLCFFTFCHVIGCKDNENICFSKTYWLKMYLNFTKCYEMLVEKQMKTSISQHFRS